ncbi:N-acetylglucosamine repressor [subsurface metagenome]
MYNKVFDFHNTANSKFQNKINKSIILNYVKNSSKLTRTLIAKDLKVSAPTVSKIIDKLIAENYVVEIGKSESAGGKRAIRLEFNSKFGSVIGVDLGKDRIRMANSDMSVNILDKHVGFEIYNEDEDLLEKVIKEINAFIKKVSSINKNIPLKAICIGVPADIETETGGIISAPLFKKWDKLNLREIFTERLGTEVFVENSKNISTIGEKNKGEGKIYNNLVFLEVGEGIGAGIVINNQLYRGFSFSAGEVGFIVDGIENLSTTHTAKGYMENVVSPRNIKKEAIRLISEGNESLIRNIVSNDLSKIDSGITCRAAMLKDKLALEIVEKVVQNLAIIVQNITLIINPQVIIIGGDILGLPDLKTLFIEPMKKMIEKNVPFKIPDIKLSSLGIDGGVIGGLVLAIENTLNKDFPYIMSRSV